MTYSPLGKAFGKQIKTIEDQVLKNLKPKQLEAIKYNKNVDKSFDDFFNKRMAEIRDLSKKINFNNLTYRVSSKYLNLINFINPGP